MATGWLFLPEARYPDGDRQRLALEEILRRVQVVPGVATAALTGAFPLSASQQNTITFEGHPKPVGHEPLLNIQFITPEYFSTVKMRVVRGRGFAPTDVRGGADVVWIDETVATKFSLARTRSASGSFTARSTARSARGPWLAW